MFTADEYSMIQNADLMPAKHRILEKTASYFGTLGQEFSQRLSDKSSTLVTYKITRGDHLEAQPWCLLDTPKMATPLEGTYFRILFWWGCTIRHQIYAPLSFNKLLTAEEQWSVVSDNIWNQRAKPSEAINRHPDQIVRFQKDFFLHQLTDTPIHRHTFELFYQIYE